MANRDAPFGFRPVRMLDGSPWNGAVTPMVIPAADGTATFIGDVVNFTAAASLAGVTANGLNLEGIPNVIRSGSGTIGQNTAGVVVGFLPDPSNLSLKHRAASTLRVALVCLADGVVFEVQEDADTTPLAAADANLNCSYTTTAGSTTTGVSGMELDSSAKAVTATLPVRLLGLSKRLGNAFNTGGSNVDQAVWEVYFNTSQQKPNIVGVA